MLQATQLNLGLMVYFAWMLRTIFQILVDCHIQVNVISIMLIEIHFSPTIKRVKSFYRMMALYVASHYKNSPNDLQLMADAPSHHLFVLLGPVDESKNHLPDILCVIQVCLEGQISRKSALKSLSQGQSPFGDQIPWKFCEQFQDTVFPGLSGVRIVRIAVHPNALGLGYGSAAVELLARYYEGQMSNFTEEDAEENQEIEETEVKVTEAAEKVSLLEENITPKANLPPLLVHLHERRPEKLHYLGVSFGLTRDLFRFWRKHNFVPFYIGQIPNNVTGEHSCMVLRALNNDEIEADGSAQYGFLVPFYQDFRKRFRRLLGTSFQTLDYKLAMSILASKINFSEDDPKEENLKSLLDLLSPYDMKRLEAYTNSSVDLPMVLDLVPTLAHHYFQEKLPVTLSPVQASILFCMGLQNRDITYIKKETKLEREQIMSSFRKVMKKLYNYLYSVAAKEIDTTMPRLNKEVTLAPHNISVDDDLNEAAREVMEKQKSENEVTLNPEYLQQYAIVDREGAFEKALQNGAKVSAGGLLSVKSSRSKQEKRGKDKEASKSKRKGKNDGEKSRSNKKRKS
ncbi:RNA cytidine acetyltransferase 1-like [Iris pallida]|uniref:RNA cytidine acetyltransferase 1-like n=1 Tax=Iris pallida TaxID=29817 RepID=A0AAX6DS98_IRIPA|nr:RNA cytidine acetyltransferase 1-like [Iris pallida]